MILFSQYYLQMIHGGISFQVREKEETLKTSLSSTFDMFPLSTFSCNTTPLNNF